MTCQQDLSSGLGPSAGSQTPHDCSLTDHQEPHLGLNGLSADSTPYSIVFADHCVFSHSIIHLFNYLIGLLYYL